MSIEDEATLDICADADTIPLGNCAELLIVPLGTPPPPEPVLIVIVTAVPAFDALTAFPTKLKLRAALVIAVPS